VRERAAQTARRSIVPNRNQQSIPIHFADPQHGGIVRKRAEDPVAVIERAVELEFGRLLEK
jgi:hypothetical protein